MDATVLRKQGWTISAIARHLGNDRKTIRTYLNGDRVVGQRANGGADLFEPFLGCLAPRLADDPHVWATALFDEVWCGDVTLIHTDDGPLYSPAR